MPPASNRPRVCRMERDEIEVETSDGLNSRATRIEDRRWVIADPWGSECLEADHRRIEQRMQYRITCFEMIRDGALPNGYNGLWLEPGE